MAWRSPCGIVLTAFLVALAPWVVATPASAAHAADRDSCPPVSIGGKPIGAISIDGRRVPLKSILRTPSGALNPPATNSAAGLDEGGVPLDASQGTSVIAWHVRYGKGCPGALNRIATAPVGTRFTISTPQGGTREYEISGRDSAHSGRLPARWFRLDGPFRVGLFTCGDLRQGVFHSTVATFATPVIPNASQL